MPRRPKSSSKNSKRPRPLKRSDASIEKWNARSDIPLEEEDEFHASRDRILLEGKDADEDLEEDDEVFALKGLDQDEDEDEDEQDYEDEVDEAETPKAKTSKSKTKNKKTKKTKRSASSSEESQEEEEDESWGRKASTYYSSNAAQIESDDEEALELEENEALRLQAKTRDGMEENDFGLNDSREENAMETDYITEPAPVVLPSLPSDKKSLLRHLEKSNPEVLSLAGDWDDSAHNLFKTHAKLNKLQSEGPDSLSLGMIHLYYQTLLTYATTLAFYLHLRADEKYAQRPETLRTHPIMERLLTLKQGLATLEDLDFSPADSDDEDDIDSEEEDVDMDFSDFQPEESLMRRIFHGGLEPLELSELLKDAFAQQEGSLNARQEDDVPKPPKKKRKISKELPKPSQPIFDLVEPEFTSTKTSLNPPAKDMALDVFGEALSLQHADAADKNARRKSLRFHTAKIESASARRQGARQALGGDDDIPYRERRKEKEARLLKETKDRIKGQGGDDLDTTEPEPRPRNQTEDGDSEDEADLDGYYNLVKKTSKLNKEKKKAEYEAEKAALRSSLDEQSADGPRSLTKAILNNRGLTPRRPKSARNPRVKKREKYDKAKKRVSSQKAVYKGGLSETGGRYEGEKSGISKVVKSVRLA
ncbi:Sas10 C-terminal domain containing protein [Amanita muscaria]